MLQIEPKNESVDSPSLPWDPAIVEQLASAALHSEDPTADTDFKSLAKELIENLRFLSLGSELSPDERAAPLAAAYLMSSAWLSAPTSPGRMADALCGALVRAHPEWREKEGEIRRLLQIGFHPETISIRDASPRERAFHDAVLALDAGKDTPHAMIRFRGSLMPAHSPEEEGRRLSGEISRLKSVRFGTLAGFLRYGKRFDKNIADLEMAVTRFTDPRAVTDPKANQKMTLSIYRSVSRNMIDMLTLADRKAGLLLNANAISLTVLVSFFGRNLASNPKMWASSVLIAGTCALTVLFASLAARPLQRKNERVGLDQFLNEGLSLLHYGDVARLSRDDFYAGYKELERDPELLERNMLSEIHFFANRIIDKFRMVRRAYMTMITGILLSCLALVLSHFR